MADILYGGPTFWSAIGRNGYSFQHGLYVVNAGQDEVFIQPINSKGKATVSRVVVPFEHIPALIAELQKFASRPKLGDRVHMPGVGYGVVEILDHDEAIIQPVAGGATERWLISELKPAPYCHSPARCPSNHWNPGNDICADCGEDLN